MTDQHSSTVVESQASREPDETIRAPQETAEPVTTQEAERETEDLSSKYDERLRGMSAKIRSLEKVNRDLSDKLETALESMPRQEAKAKEDPKTDAGLVERVRILEERDKSLAEKESKLKARAIRTEIRNAVEGAGIDGASAWADLIAHKKARMFEALEDEDSGDYAVLVNEAEGVAPSTVADWFGAFLQSDEGQSMLPPRSQPSAKRSAKGVAKSGKRRVSKSEMLALSTEELKTGNYTLAE